MTTTAAELLQTEQALTFVKDVFTRELTRKLKLVKVSSPIIVLDGTGINDDLNGVERAVSFPVKALEDQKAVVVHSLAKWKRMRLKELGIEAGRGLLTHMHALRPDEDYSPIHSVYVDQWDWEKHILPEQRTLSYLKETVTLIYEALKQTELQVFEEYPDIFPVLPPEIHFIHAEELLKRYPDSTVKERETLAAKEFGAVFIFGIGGKLSDGEPHDGRAPDYDDWSSENEDGFLGLNGDIVLWNPVLKSAFEISSMGVRVDKIALLRQLEIRACTSRTELHFHKMLLSGSLPESIGGGIGQSRVCMFLLRKSHIGEVQVSVWSDEVKDKLYREGISLL